MKPTVYIDADACPVKEQTFKVAKRYELKVVAVSNVPIHLPRADYIEAVVVGNQFDAVDDWIDSHVQPNDIVVTNDLLLAARILKREARVIEPRGRVLTDETIGDALATRELMAELRQRGEMNLGPSKTQKKHTSNYLDSLDRLINAAIRGKK